MKTRRLISICVCMLWAIFASAYDFSEKNEDGVMLYYTNLEAGFCEVAQGPDDYKGKVVIPQIANGRIVVGIGSKAFWHNTQLESVVLPNTVLYIGSIAFADCYDLKSVDLGNVMLIGEMTFGGCFDLKDLKIPESVEYCGYDAFSACGIDHPLYNSHYFLYFPDGYATTYSIPEGIETIGVAAFSGTGIKKVTFPESLKKIEAFAFDGSFLTSLNLPSSVTSIGDNAFAQCYQLHTSVTIPSSVTEMGEYIFMGSDIKKCDFQNKFEKLPNGTFSSCSELKEVHLPENLKSIGEYAFASDEKLTAYNLPDYLESIGRYAFYSCKSIKSFTVPEGVKRLEELTFCECEGLKSINLPSTLEYLGAWAIMGCPLLESITLPERLSYIEIAALGHNKALKDVYVSWKEPLTEITDPFNNSFSSAWGEPYAGTLHVPAGTKQLYAESPVWKDFQNIVEDVSTDIPTYYYTETKTEKVFSNGKVVIRKNNDFYDASSGVKIMRK